MSASPLASTMAAISVRSLKMAGPWNWAALTAECIMG
ncbi:hypothetical protein PVAG01_05647 [Phlyctema vagabunda]|uniref:ABC transporter permease n=1 Tax=Phlyctema vagabunda TaxID=108571 RepID=A0ABR4PKN1_9HELO